MKSLLAFSIIISIVCIGCGKDNFGVIINPGDSLSFHGVFATAAYYGQVTLFINNGVYECNTNMINGRGAGRLKADEITLQFTDTLVFPVQAIYGPSFVLSGTYMYLFDGNKLEIQKIMNGGKIKYEFYLIKSN